MCPLPVLRTAPSRAYSCTDRVGERLFHDRPTVRGRRLYFVSAHVRHIPRQQGHGAGHAVGSRGHEHRRVCVRGAHPCRVVRREAMGIGLASLSLSKLNKPIVLAESFSLARCTLPVDDLARADRDPRALQSRDTRRRACTASPRRHCRGPWIPVATRRKGLVQHHIDHGSFFVAVDLAFLISGVLDLTCIFREPGVKARVRARYKSLYLIDLESFSFTSLNQQGEDVIGQTLFSSVFLERPDLIRETKPDIRIFGGIVFCVDGGNSFNLGSVEG